MTNSQDEVEIARLRAFAPDYKESIEIGRDWNSTWKNMWPRESDVPGFKAFMLDFYQVSSLISSVFPEILNLSDRHATNCMSV